MIHLPAALRTWGTPDFAAALKRELACQAAGLPLQAALAASSSVSDGPIETMLIGAREEAACIRAKVGVFFSGIVAGCSCADDPTPVEPQPEYCELLLAIDMATARTDVTLLETE